MILFYDSLCTLYHWQKRSSYILITGRSVIKNQAIIYDNDKLMDYLFVSSLTP